jgi:hypothetical protein
VRKLLLMCMFSLLGIIAITSEGKANSSGGPICGATVWCRNGQVINCFGYASYEACYYADQCWIMCDGNATFCDDRPYDCPWVY